MNCYECDVEIVGDNFYYSSEDTNEICPKCYGEQVIVYEVIGLDYWEDTYNPCVNYRDPKNLSWQDEHGNGRMFETYEEDKQTLDAVDSVLPYHIWSYVDLNGGTAIVNGYVWNNAIGHFITEKAWEQGNQLLIWVIKEEN